MSVIKVDFLKGNVINRLKASSLVELGNRDISGKIDLDGKNWKYWLPKLVVLAVFIIICSLIFSKGFYNNERFSIYSDAGITYERGVVAKVLVETLEESKSMPGLMLGEQTISVLMRNGEDKGNEVLMKNILSTTHNILVRKGITVVVKADRPKNAQPFFSLYNYDRTAGLITVVIIFGLLMLIVARVKGLRALGSLAIALFFVLAFLIPEIFSGKSPVWASIITVILTSIFSILLLNGFSKKSYTALAAVVVGVLSTAK